MTATILIVDDEENARSNIRIFLNQRGYEVLEAATLAEARDVIRRGAADLILLDVQLDDGYGPTLLEETAHLPNRPLIILITAHGDVDMAVDAMKNGARDFIQKPIRLAQLEKSIERASEIIHLKRELAHLREERNTGMDFVIGKSEAMLGTVETTRRAAAAQVSVLITGRTGTGKEILAKMLHQSGPRAQKPFIALNCAAVQSTMVESELFGHEAGAFTSADKRKPGLMETADGGILFLDEISSMSLEMQAKLLRALEERSFRRVGGTNLIKVDVQVVAASNRDLKAMMEEGTFREDLYYRLKVVDLHLPALSERREDIPELVGLFIRKNNMSMGVNVSDVTPKAMEALMNYSWPGNIRELRNVMERAMLFCDGPSIDLSDLPSELHHLR
jgi:two-component system, NtrC family, response regulator AtoC